MKKIDKSAIFHLAKTNYSYAYDEDSINVRLRTRKDDFEKVNIIYGDKYKDHTHRNETMKKILSDYEYDYYEINLKVNTRRIAYFFELHTNDKILYYTEYGIQENMNFMNEIHMHYFQYPFINRIDVHKKPSWTDDAIFYQIFPDRFNNANPNINPENIEPWGSKPKHDNLMGGDLEGIIEKIPYLKDLGVNVIYLTPIFKSNSNHKYDTIDYYEIDPHFGTKRDLKKLVEELHKNEMKLVLDAVFNHSGIDFFAFKDVCEKGEKSKYKDWFYIKKFPVDLDKIIKKYKTTKDWKNWYLDENGNDITTYETFAFYPYMPKLNTECEELRKYLIEVGKYWVREYGIDGWRLDVANEIDHNFWREFRKEVKSINEDTYIIGEVWHNAEAWLRGDQFDSIMNYPITNLIKRYFALDIINKEEFKYGINEVLMRNTQQVNEMMLNLLDSHDVERYYNTCSGKKSKLILSYAFMFTFIGIPMIYYGGEVGMKGGQDPDCRRCMDWDESSWDKKIYNSIKSIIKLRKNSSAIRKGTFRWIELHKDIVSFIRESDDEKILVLFNNDKIKKSIKLSSNITLEYDIINEQAITDKNIVIKSNEFRVFKIKK